MILNALYNIPFIHFPEDLCEIFWNCFIITRNFWDRIRHSDKTCLISVENIVYFSNATDLSVWWSQQHKFYSHVSPHHNCKQSDRFNYFRINPKLGFWNITSGGKNGQNVFLVVQHLHNNLPKSKRTHNSTSKNINWKSWTQMRLGGDDLVWVGFNFANIHVRDNAIALLWTKLIATLLEQDSVIKEYDIAGQGQQQWWWISTCLAEAERFFIYYFCLYLNCTYIITWFHGESAQHSEQPVCKNVGPVDCM